MMDRREPLSPVTTPGKRKAAVLAVLMHVLLGLFLFYGVNWQNNPPESMSVDLVRSVPLPASKPPVTEPQKTPTPAPKVEPRPPEPQRTSPAKPDIAIKDKQKPKKEPPKKEVPKKPQPKPKPVQPAFDPMRALLQETAQRDDARLRSAAAQEQAASARGRAVADYMAKIRDKVRGNIVVPPNVSGNPEAIFDVVQLPSGEILSVRLKKGSGNAALDAAIERAILKSSPLPKPQQGDIFSRNLQLRIRPLQE